MNRDVPVPRGSWRRSRYGFAGFYFLSLWGAWFLGRLVLLAVFHPPALAIQDATLAILSGVHRDLYAALLETLPLLAWLLVVFDRSFGATWHRLVFLGGMVAAIFVQVFLLFAEFFFFDEFKSRFNTVAVDYLLYPKEVFINIWQSYHVGWVLLLCLTLSLAWIWCASRCFPDLWEQPVPRKTRFLWLAGAVALTGVMTPTLSLNGARISKDRTLNEIANNGALAFLAAAWTHDLDYAAYYKTMPVLEAFWRTRRLLTESNTTFVEDGASIRRRVAGDPSRPRLNVVILLEESLGSEFWGCLGRPRTLTPEMDKLAREEGMLFTNLYACGNRTVRGMEGVLSSFPPLPGDSIVKRDRSDNVETIARVLKRDGYETVFLYGGRGLFDGMRSFAVRNGYDRFVEEKHFAHPTFSTIWGVCDEDLFARSIAEFRELAKTNTPFFATILSVSNHKPYTYPKGRIEEPRVPAREDAVKYSDYALGQFFRAARKEAFWTNTIFAVVADHGARVYGKQSIPIHSYEIPLLIAGPAVVNGPSRVSQLGSSLDVAPTLLGLLGRPYETLFFGRNLLKSRPVDGRAFLNHNRDIGMLMHDRLVILGLMQTVEFYGGNPKVAEMSQLPQAGDADQEIEKDAIAVFQVADELYTGQRYRLDPPAAR